LVFGRLTYYEDSFDSSADIRGDKSQGLSQRLNFFTLKDRETETWKRKSGAEWLSKLISVEK
jgi:hypothetical protein